MMKPRSIKSRITLLVLLFGVLMIAINHLVNQTWVVGRRLSRLEEEAVATAKPLSGILQHLLRRKQERAAELEMSYAALSTKLELGLVCGSDGIVRFSTQLRWRGMKIEETPVSGQWPEIVKALEARDSVNIWSADKTNLTVGSRFYEGFDASSKGVVVMNYDYTRELEQVRVEALHESLTQVAILAALCLLVWYSMDELVIRRVIKVVEYARGYPSAGGIPKVLEGDDELSMISADFSDVVKRLRESENQVLEAAETERRRIGRELHDDLCQRITATKLKAEVVHGMLSGHEGKEAALAEQLAEELSESAVIARGIARGLSPVGLEKDGMQDALDDMARFMYNSYSVHCTISYMPVHEHLSGSAQELLFRIAQELAVNASKHSKPRNMTVSLRIKSDEADAKPSSVELIVMHDGSPFQENPDTSKNGMGLHLLKQRLFALSATLERSENEGAPEISVATVRIPLKNGMVNTTLSP